MMINNGWNTDVTEKQYFTAPEVSFSDLSLALKGALQWANRKAFPLDSSALQVGTDFHNLALLGKWPGKATQTAKKHLEAMQSQLQALKLYRTVMSMEDLQIEIPGFYDGFKCKPDIRVPSLGLIIDLKTTTDATPWGFKWSAKKFNYHLQARHYLDVANKIAGEKKYNNFLFVAVEKSSPYNAYIHECSPGVLEQAGELKEQALDLIKLYKDDVCLKKLVEAEQNQIHEISF